MKLTCMFYIPTLLSAWMLWASWNPMGFGAMMSSFWCAFEARHREEKGIKKVRMAMCKTGNEGQAPTFLHGRDLFKCIPASNICVSKSPRTQRHLQAHVRLYLVLRKIVYLDQ
ncbi:hypothetical protein DL98DRAFT_273103 [Cadophora sp. DSE1049]|nr:hypothetical protein DL98DRAFT_273103 [Cadophora sp. DSE1049]